jgi:hypothetical protein
MSIRISANIRPVHQILRKLQQSNITSLAGPLHAAGHRPHRLTDALSLICSTPIHICSTPIHICSTPTAAHCTQPMGRADAVTTAACIVQRTCRCGRSIAARVPPSSCDRTFLSTPTTPVAPSKGLCQQERGADALGLVFMVEDGEEERIRSIEVRSEKTPMGRVRRRTSRKRRSMAVVVLTFLRSARDL